MNGFKRAAVSCILIHRDKYLLIQRKKAPYIGKFLPVGGKIDAHESATTAAIREVYEETGLHIQAPSYCGCLIESSPIDDYNWVCFIFKAQIEDMLPPACDEGVLTWIDKDDLDTLDIPPTDLPIYKAIQADEFFVFEAQFDIEMKMLNFERLQ